MRGNNFILKIPVPSKCLVLLRSLKIAALEATIPKQSKKMVKFKIFSKVCAKNKMTIHTAAKMVKEKKLNRELGELLGLIEPIIKKEVLFSLTS